jgi:hypothetical protein
MKKTLTGLLLTLLLFIAAAVQAEELFKYESVKSQAVGGKIDDIALGAEKNGANIYVLFHNTSSDYQIKVFSQDLTQRFSFGKSDLNAGADKYFQPYNIAIGADENVYVLGLKQDSFGYKNVIRKFNKNGMLQLEWEGPASSRPELAAVSLAINSSGNIFLAIPEISSIYKYDSSGRVIKKFRDKTLSPDMITVNTQNIFVFDQLGAIRKYDFNFDLIDELKFKSISEAVDFFSDASGFYLQTAEMIYKYNSDGSLAEEIRLPVRTASSGIAIQAPGSSPRFIFSDGTRLNEIKPKETSTTPATMVLPSTTLMPVREQEEAPVLPFRR